jgi:hypothetical protein
MDDVAVGIKSTKKLTIPSVEAYAWVGTHLEASPQGIAVVLL